MEGDALAVGELTGEADGLRGDGPGGEWFAAAGDEYGERCGVGSLFVDEPAQPGNKVGVGDDAVVASGGRIAVGAAEVADVVGDKGEFSGEFDGRVAFERWAGSAEVRYKFFCLRRIYLRVGGHERVG